MRILMIEDDLNFAAAVKEGIEMRWPGYAIVHCPTLVSATAQLKSGKFDAALIDLCLPDGQDTEILMTVKALAPQLPVVALTGRDFDELGADLLKLGIQDFLQKGDVSLVRIDQCLRMACERQNREEELRKQAAFDPLTGLANRNELNARLFQALGNAARRHLKLAVIAIDLDGFKDVNDIYGHASGDVVLQTCARRLLRWVRASDCVARIGGDEFIVVLEPITSLADAVIVAEKIRRHLGKPIDFEGQVCRVSASLGIAVYPEHDDTGDGLCRMADIAMYAAKRNGDVSIRVYHPGQDNRMGSAANDAADHGQPASNSRAGSEHQAPIGPAGTVSARTRPALQPMIERRRPLIGKG